jgi:mRNA interferase MazF
MVINQYEIYWTDLDPTKGSELEKTRPCVVISPNEMNHNINTVIIAPVTSASKNYPTRINIKLEEVNGWVVIDQIRCVDKTRLKKKAGKLDSKSVFNIKNVIKEMLVD